MASTQGSQGARGSHACAPDRGSYRQHAMRMTRKRSAWATPGRCKHPPGRQCFAMASTWARFSTSFSARRTIARRRNATSAAPNRGWRHKEANEERTWSDTVRRACQRIAFFHNPSGAGGELLTKGPSARTSRGGRNTLSRCLLAEGVLARLLAQAVLARAHAGQLATFDMVA